MGWSLKQIRDCRIYFGISIAWNPSNWVDPKNP